MSNGADNDNTNAFKLERYKFILQEIHSLNVSIHKYLTLYQKLVTAIIGGGVTILVSWQKLNISPEIAKAGMQALVGLLIILTLFVIVLILASAFSWFDYRNEEVKLLDDAIKPGFRHRPKIGNFWRWNETYIIVFLVLFMVVIVFYTETRLVPLIK